MRDGRSKTFAWAIIGTVAYAALSVYFRFRPQPRGVNGSRRTYRVPFSNISFIYDASWYEGGERKTERNIMDEVIATVRGARRFVLIDVFLFNLHHISKGPFIPTTRQVADAFRGKQHQSVFLTDPLNTSYGTARCEPLAWLEENGVQVCIIELEKLRDNNLLYAPLWKLLLRWFGTGGSGWLQNPLRERRTTTLRAVLAALTLRGNHRKVVIGDDADSWTTVVTSSNFEDASCYFSNTGLKIRSRSVARHFFEAEKAVARMSGCPFDFKISEDVPGERTPVPEAEVTPLMGGDIRDALLEDLRRAGRGDELYVFALFLSDRQVIGEIVSASRRGVSVALLLDRNNVSFGSEKNGYPNHVVASEIVQRCDISPRYANLDQEEFHTKFVLLRQEGTCSLITGSANLTRRSLSDTNLEASVRVAATDDAPFMEDALAYARRLMRPPYSIPATDLYHSRWRHAWYRVQETIGIATF